MKAMIQSSLQILPFVNQANCMNARAYRRRLVNSCELCDSESVYIVIILIKGIRKHAKWQFDALIVKSLFISKTYKKSIA